MRHDRLGLLDGLINGCIFTAASPLKSVTCVVTTDPILMSGKRGLCPVEEFMHGCMLAPMREALCPLSTCAMRLCGMHRKLCVEGWLRGQGRAISRPQLRYNGVTGFTLETL